MTPNDDGSTPTQRWRASIHPGDLAPPLGIALVYLVMVLVLVHPLWSIEAATILGDADTDAVRGMWGLDHLRRSLFPPNTPIWSFEINHPSGVMALVLPWFSGLLSAPLGWIVGPVHGFNATIMGLLWAAGMATAVLTRTRTRSWVAGGVAGAAMPAAPMLLHAVADGTPEHVAMWLMPVFFALATKLSERPSRTLALVTGFAAVMMVLDSPYHGVFAAVLSVFVLTPLLLVPWTPLRRREGPASIAVLVTVLAFGALAIAFLFRAFPTENTSSGETLRLLQMNAADLHTWWQYEFGGRHTRDPSLAPTVIPAWVLWPAILFGVLGLPRSAPWLAAGAATLILSFGLNPRLPAELAVWLGDSGRSVGATILSVNDAARDLPGIRSVRFPHRWLVMATFAFAVAGGDGVARAARFIDRRGWMPPLFRVVGALAVLGASVGALWAGLRTAAFHAPFPAHSLPAVSFATWVAEVPEEGAVVLLPQRRPAPKSGKRADLPVFANISEHLSSTDSWYLQVQMGRPLIGYPSLKTLAPMRIDTDTAGMIQNWDDIALPVLSGRDIPSSAIHPSFAAHRQVVVDGMVADGLRFVIVDEAAYGPSGIQHLKDQLGDHILEQHHFDDGTGVTVFRLH